MNKEFLILPSIIMNLSQRIYGADDFGHRQEIHQGIKSSTPIQKNKAPKTTGDLEHVSIAKNDIFDHSKQSKAVTVTTSDMIANLLDKFVWKSYAYMYGNSSISYNHKESQFDFNKDNSFYMINSFGEQTGTYEIIDGGLTLTYTDGFTQVHEEIFMEYNKESELYFLLVSEQNDRFKGCYSVYVSSRQK